MTARRRLRRALALSLGLAAVSVSIPGETAAAPAPISDVVWWSRNPVAQAPAGGFQVAAAPDGPVSVAAFHLQTSGNVQHATLTLTEAGGSTVNASGATLVICPTFDTFTASNDHTYASAPKPACERAKASLTRDASTATWTGDITTVLAAASSPASVMVLPDPSATPTLTQIEFRPPAVDLNVGSVIPSPSTPAFTGAPSSAINSAPTFVPPRPPVMATPTAPAVPATPAANNDSGVQALVQPRSFVPTSDTSPANGTNPWLKGLTLILLASAAGVSAGVGRRYLMPKFS